MRRLVMCLFLCLSLSNDVAYAQSIAVGSKSFTEGVILGEVLALMLERNGASVTHHKGLGGTQFVWQALLRGEIDAYVDYTGTLREEIFAQQPVGTDAALRDALTALNLKASRPLGFNNTYAFAMRREKANAMHLDSISQLRQHPNLKLGFTSEFLDRGDGWRRLSQAYSLPHRDVVGLEHDLAYRGLQTGAFDVMDVYSTDAEIAAYDLHVLTDDLGYFPTYNAVVVFRADLTDRLPDAEESIALLAGAIDESAMITMNRRAKIDGIPEEVVAADFVRERFSVTTRRQTETWIARLRHNTWDHVMLVLASMTAAILVAVPAGIVSAQRPRMGRYVLGAVGVVQTIPALALLVFMIPLLGIGSLPAIVALFLYSLLPIVRNTHSALNTLPLDLQESALALGLPRAARLRLIELPMISPAILAGIKTSAVINIGTATLGALIGAGGYGQPILTGIRLNDVNLILQGAIPAAVLALLVQTSFDGFERWIVPSGLRGSRAQMIVR